MTAHRRCVIRAAKAAACRCRKKASRSRSARAASCAKGTRWRCCPWGGRGGEPRKPPREPPTLALPSPAADARFAKPLDVDLLLRLAREHEVLMTIEEGSIGGFGSLVLPNPSQPGAVA